MLGWHPPKTRKKRRAFIEHCGRKCFLQPRRHGFPICSPSCKPSCDGLRAAFSRARQMRRQGVARAALRRACKLHCPWTKARGRCER